MHADWSVECSAEDPIVAVPWSAGDSAQASDLDPAAFIDLRRDPGLIELIPEASEHPALAAALRQLNRVESAVFTAKCDAWPLDPHELESITWLLPGTSPAAGFGSYIDLLCRASVAFASFQLHETWLRRLAGAASALPPDDASADFVLRPARVRRVDPVVEEEVVGFAVTVYAYGFGNDADSAYSAWECALQSLTELVE